MSNVYNDKFVDVVRSFLKVRCSNGKRVTRESIVAHLEKCGMQVSSELVGLAVTEGAFNTLDREWAPFAGRYGGIREVALDGRTIAARIRKLPRVKVESTESTV